MAIDKEAQPYKINPDWDTYILDEDRDDPLDVTYTDVIEAFERLIERGKKEGFLIDSPENVEARVDAYIYWYIHLSGLRELHKRYHEAAEILDLVIETERNGEFDEKEDS